MKGLLAAILFICNISLFYGNEYYIHALGALECGRTYVIEYDTNNSRNYFNRDGYFPQKDFECRFYLPEAMDIAFTHCGSELETTCMALFKGSFQGVYTENFRLAEDSDPMGREDPLSGYCSFPDQARLFKTLRSGYYSLTSEGVNENGLIRLTVYTSKAEYLEPEPQNIAYHNYVKKIIPLAASTSAVSESPGSSITTIQFYDGLGRESTTLGKSLSPTYKDIISRQVYDGAGRKSKHTLEAPYNAGGKYLDQTDCFTISKKHHEDSHAYTEIFYENSPTTRVTKQFGAGEKWYNNDKGQTFSYLLNELAGDYSCAKYAVVSDKLYKQGNYPAGSLHVTIVEDEDGKMTYLFENKEGQLLLSRQFNDGQKHDTYYVYDDWGRKRFVLPPLASDNLQGDGQIRNGALTEYSYTYKYDERGRCVEKTLPMSRTTYYVYDKADRLRMSQDPNQRRNNEWIYYKYDALGREVIQGIYKKGNSTEDFSHQAMINNIASISYAMNESFLLTNSDLYTCQSYPTTTSRMITLLCNYYDNYNFANSSYCHTQFKHNISFVSGVSDAEHTSAQGLLTAQKARVLDDLPSFLWTCYRYNQKAQPVQVYSMNILWGIDKEFMRYTFTGQLKEKYTVYSCPTVAIERRNITEKYVYEYDHAGRVKTITRSENGESTQLIESNTYDELGRVKSQLAKQERSYTYNIRNWVTSIQSPTYKEWIYYETPLNTASPVYYNGNISATVNKTHSVYCAQQIPSGYKYYYDGLDRLTYAKYGEGDDLSQRVDNFSEKLQYDKHGNIKRKENYRRTTSGGSELAQALTYGYAGNELEHVSNNVPDILDYGTQFFQDRDQTGGIEYYYDDNGNLNGAHDKNISMITYNHLNLPNKILFTNGNSLFFIYDATGKKHASYAAVPRSGYTIPIECLRDRSERDHYVSTYETKQYVGSLTFFEINNCGFDLERIKLPHGFRQFFGDIIDKYEQLTDHLGNVRAETEGSSTATYQWSHYYPFGIQYNHSGTHNYIGNMQGEGFGGKMLEKWGGLNWYDFTNRMYDAALGRWPTPDPLAEMYPWMSPYAYCGNNPVNRFDPDGRDWYRSNEEYNSYVWQEGDEDIEGFTNIGSSVSIQLGENSYLNFYQNAGILANQAVNAFEIITMSDKLQSDLLGRNSILSEDSKSTLFNGLVNRQMSKLGHTIGQELVTQAVASVIGFGIAKATGYALGQIGARSAATNGTYTVYRGVDAANKARYIGITGRDASIRFAEHLNSVGTGREVLRYRIVKGATNLSKTQAKILEQTLINQYGLGKNGGILLNKINSIAPKYWQQYGITTP